MNMSRFSSTTRFSPRRRPRRSSNRLPILLAVLGLIAVGAPAAYAAMAVIDAQNLSQNAKTAATTIKQLAELKKQVEQLTSILKTAQDTLGALGKPKQALKRALPEWASGITTSVSAQVPNFELWQLGQKAGVPNINSIPQTIEFLQKQLASALPGTKDAKPLTPQQRLRIPEKRTTVLREVAFRAMASAQNAIGSADEASNSVNTLLSAPSVDLREQIAVLTEATVAIHQEQVLMRTLLATQLELQAALAVRGLPVEVGLDQTLGGNHTEGGGAGDLNDPFAGTTP